MDEEQGSGLSGVQILLQVCSQCEHVLCILFPVGSLQVQQLFMAEHIAGKPAGGLFQYVGQSHVVKVVNPQVGLFSAPHIQGCAGLDILASQVHVPFHGAAVSSFQETVPDKVSELSCHSI